MSKRLQVYEAPGITVTFDPNLCVHSGACIRGLPDVFDVGRKRWVRPELASTARCGHWVQCSKRSLFRTLRATLDSQRSPSRALTMAIGGI